jgi:hypothetical protein
MREQICTEVSSINFRDGQPCFDSAQQPCFDFAQQLCLGYAQHPGLSSRDKGWDGRINPVVSTPLNRRSNPIIQQNRGGQ